MSKTELDIKLDEHLINAAREIKLHCKGTMHCADCIFFNKHVNGHVICGISNVPTSWEVDSDKL